MTRRYTITIRLSEDKNSKPIAHYWGLARRWIPLEREKAELAISTGTLFGVTALPPH